MTTSKQAHSTPDNKQAHSSTRDNKQAHSTLDNKQASNHTANQGPKQQTASSSLACRDPKERNAVTWIFAPQPHPPPPPTHPFFFRGGREGTDKLFLFNVLAQGFAESLTVSMEMQHSTKPTAAVWRAAQHGD